MQQINAIGDVCPLPVVKTKKALREMSSGCLEVLVDNEIAVENIRKHANSAGCDFTVNKQGDHFAIQIEKREDTASACQAEPTQADVSGKTVVVLTSDVMGIRRF